MAGRVLGELDAVMAPWFARAATRLAAQQYVRGLASTVERKNSWQLADHAGHSTPDRLQRLLSCAASDEAGVREDVRCWAVGALADPDAVLVADDTGFLKHGRSSAGVQRQYSGMAGRIENCQIGVFLTYAAGRGRLLVEAELYLPVSWTDDPHRCARAGIPAGLGFATKPQLAQLMIERVVRERLPFGWVAADEAYGDNPGQRLSCGDGAKGPLLYDFATIPDATSPHPRVVIRRAIDDGEPAFFWSHAPGQRYHRLRNNTARRRRARRRPEISALRFAGGQEFGGAEYTEVLNSRIWCSARCVARSASAMIPTSRCSSSTGSRRILWSSMRRRTSETSASASTQTGVP